MSEEIKSPYTRYASTDYVDEKIANINSIKDWNQNDETAPDYIKNRTHWVENMTFIESPLNNGDLYEEVGVTIFIINSPISPLTVGNTYTVNWLDTEYEVIATDMDGSITLGNLSIMEMGNDTLEPFLIGVFPDGVKVCTKESITEGNISIKGENAHKLDKKYLPEIQNKNILDGSEKGSVRTVGANTEIGKYAFAEGYDTTASGKYSHAEGNNTTASGEASHAEGWHTTASNYFSHTEGIGTTASGESSHAEGNSTTASGSRSHAEGGSTTASGVCSHAEGYMTTASGDYQHVQGKYSINDASNKYAHIVGNGEYNALSNAHTLDWEGNAWFQGDIKLGGTSQDDTTAKSVLTSDYITAGTTDLEAGVSALPAGHIYLVLEQE